MTEQSRPLVHAGGRPSKAEQLLTPEMMEEVGALLAEGNYKETVADYLGIDRKTWWNWEQRGGRDAASGDDTIFAQFFHMVKRSSALGEVLLFRDIRSGRLNWQARAWIMERRFPDRWGKRIDITIRREAERLAETLGCTAEELIADAERIASEAGGHGR